MPSLTYILFLVRFVPKHPLFYHRYQSTRIYTLISSFLLFQNSSHLKWHTKLPTGDWLEGQYYYAVDQLLPTESLDAPRIVIYVHKYNGTVSVSSSSITYILACWEYSLYYFTFLYTVIAIFCHQIYYIKLLPCFHITYDLDLLNESHAHYILVFLSSFPTVIQFKPCILIILNLSHDYHCNMFCIFFASDSIYYLSVKSPKYSIVLSCFLLYYIFQDLQMKKETGPSGERDSLYYLEFKLNPFTPILVHQNEVDIWHQLLVYLKIFLL